MAILFYDENIKSRLKEKKKIKAWFINVIEKENKKPGQINVILTTDEYLRKINQKYLSRNYYTDIITFDYSHKNEISGDMFISLERVEENSVKYKEGKHIELLRVMIHGLLHLIGYSDSKTEEKNEMKSLEDQYLKLFTESW